MDRKLVPFLEKYDTILFDMDGVITSEQNYWNVAALVVYEMLNSNAYFGEKTIDTEEYATNISAIRDTVFCSDKIIRLLKNRGVNSNWDLAYVTLAVALILKTSDFDKVFEYLNNLNEDAFALYDRLGSALTDVCGFEKEYAKRLGPLWIDCTNCFQEWFLGDEKFREVFAAEPKQPGKTGLLYMEQPIIPKDELHLLLSLLNQEGKRLGIGTGRPFIEIMGPFENWDIQKYFDENSCITYTDVINTEKRLNLKDRGINLTKPHPYMFLKGALGREYDDEKIISGAYDKAALKRTLAVGDAGADLMAAQDAGIDFLAVLTGVAGAHAKEYFEQNHATYILGSVLDLMV